MMYRVGDALARAFFNKKCRNILKTPSLIVQDSDLIILSMISHKDLLMYLIAIKSLYGHLKQGNIIVINDGSLDKNDLDLLKYHINPVVIVSIDSIDTGPCPSGGAWERLVAIMELIEHSYVIQLDADTVTVEHPSQVREHYLQNRPFTLGTRMCQEILPLPEFSKVVRGLRGDHINLLGEQVLSNLPQMKDLKYVRGCAGFTGFAKNCFSKGQLEEFSASLSEPLGERWTEWGTEQIASNFIISNATDGRVLPYPAYANFDPRLDRSESKFIHFIGTYRFWGGVYARTARDFIARVNMS
jgi:hypothetical protein